MATVPEIPSSRRWVWCEDHRKRGWLDMPAAAAARRAMADGDDMDIYPCTVAPATLHIGHPSRAVIALNRLQRAQDGAR